MVALFPHSDDKRTMCGFIGAMSRKTSFIRGLDLGPTLQCIKHRGPDSSGEVSLGENFRVGAVRLAMTDPQARSDQPMLSEGRGLTFNGEIFNYRALRGELEARGIEFLTDGDTEVLLRILELDDLELLARIQGMFAFAWVDPMAQRVIFGRDALGKKPLYLAQNQDITAWGSSAEEVRKLAGIDPAVGTEALFDYLEFGFTVAPHSILKGVMSLRPGFKVELSLNGEFHETPLWRQKQSGRAPSKAELYLALEEACRLRVEGHPNPAILLSGGIDSALVALMASRTAREPHAYTAVWTDSDKARYNSDALAAEKIASEIGIKWTAVEMPSASEIPQRIREFTKIMGEPLNNPSGISSMCMFERIAANGHRLALTGDGADEIFAGYPRYRRDLDIPALLRALGKVPGVQRLAQSKIQTESEKFRRVARALLSPDVSQRYRSWHWVFSPKEIESWMPKLRDVRADSPLVDRDPRLGLLGLSMSEKSALWDMAFDRDIWLTEQSNRLLDRVSMARSIEARSPFQEEKVIELALNLDTKELFGSGLKPTLRNLLKNEPIMKHVRQDKWGFISPIGHWIRASTEDIKSTTLDQAKYFNFNESRIRKLIYDAPRGSHIQRVQLWTIYALSVWSENLNENRDTNL